MTAKEAVQAIGKTVKYVIDSDTGMWINVKIVDIRSAYGRNDYRIEPISGGGEKWVSSGISFDNL